MIKGEKWVMGGKELWHLFFFRKKALINIMKEFRGCKKLHMDD
jgi:hypothetical protein